MGQLHAMPYLALCAHGIFLGSEFLFILQDERKPDAYSPVYLWCIILSAMYLLYVSAS